MDRPPGALTVLCVALLGTGCVPDRPVRSQLDALLVDVPCATAVRGELAGARATQALPGARTMDASGTSTVRFPTADRGVWVTLQVRSPRPPVVQRVSPATVRTVRYDADCVGAVESAPRREVPLPRPARFTDADLIDALDSETMPLVVYVWSPHMPLSVDGWREIATATRQLGWRVEPVLMPGSDADFARVEATRVGIPAAGLREADANELVFRDGLVHAPTIIVYGGDRVSPALPGYRNTAGYLRYLEAFDSGGQAVSSRFGLD